MPLSSANATEQELALVAAGRLVLPVQELDEKRFGQSARKTRFANQKGQRLGAPFPRTAKSVMTAFWGASALVPLVIPSQGAAEVRGLLPRFKPVVWWGSTVEICSAVARLSRQGDLTPRQQKFAAERLALLRLQWQEIQPTAHLRELAESQIGLYALRSADALQLGAALDWSNEKPKAHRFVYSDRRLGEAAQHAGFILTALP